MCAGLEMCHKRACRGQPLSGTAEEARRSGVIRVVRECDGGQVQQIGQNVYVRSSICHVLPACGGRCTWLRLSSTRHQCSIE